MRLDGLLGDVASVQMGLVVRVRDGAVLEHYTRRRDGGDAKHAARHLAAWIRASADQLRAIEAWSGDATMTVESARAHLVVEVLDDRTVLAVGFEPTTPKGLARLHCARVSAAVRGGEASLPPAAAPPAPPAEVTPPPSLAGPPEPHAQSPVARRPSAEERPVSEGVPAPKRRPAPQPPMTWPPALSALADGHPNPRIGCARVSVRTGIDAARLHRPDEWTAAETERVTQAVDSLVAESNGGG